MSSRLASSASLGRPLQLVLELGLGRLDFTGARADRARHPVERAQLVDDRAADPGHREGLEFDPALGLEALDRADQAHQAVGDQVGVVDVRGQAGAEAAGDELDHRRVGDDQALARAGVAVLLVAAPKIAQLHLFYAGFHANSPAFYGRWQVIAAHARGWVAAYASRRRAASTRV